MGDVARRLERVPSLLVGFLLLGAVLPGGCGRKPIQSALHPAGSAAAQIAGLWWFLFAIGTGVLLVVVGLLVVGLFRRSRGARTAPPLGGIRFVLISGIFVPAVLLVAMLVASLQTTAALKLPTRALTVRIIGHQWWWEVQYPDAKITTANEIEIPVGQPVRLELTSADVAHSFWVPRLNGKIDLIPGHTNAFWIAANRPGTYRGQCAEFCGAQHAHMAFFVAALPPEQFRAWIEERQRPHAAPATRTISRGHQVFFLAGCKDCHTVRGGGASGRVGPDLTHVGSRLTLGAGTLPNTTGNLEGWISNAHSVKPGVKMPRMYLSPGDLHAVRAYLQSLK